ncbi:phospholipase A2 inhibitor and Ly6/PLAUR domain-containing protein-like [Huso huso]|uniref:Phospholipase A2 inhibitor and Ly6/PLAUR domain-containing protein-like n=1 Tax=Huso huso TaxID=61971 RepID=A0ABR0Y5E7_HUSHU
MLKMRRLLLALCTVCALLPAVSTLSCHSCRSTTGPCTGKPNTCTSGDQQCLTSTSKEISAGVTTMVHSKSCTSPAICLTPISKNFGVTKSTINVKCCNTDLCNTETIPAHEGTTPSGLQCYGCEKMDCSSYITIKCLSNENRCMMIAGGTENGGQQILKGCVSKNVCDAAHECKCCEGNLCNGSRRVGQNILLLRLLPLLTFKLLF